MFFTWDAISAGSSQPGIFSYDNSLFKNARSAFAFSIFSVGDDCAGAGLFSNFCSAFFAYTYTINSPWRSLMSSGKKLFTLGVPSSNMPPLTEVPKPLTPRPNLCSPILPDSVNQVQLPPPFGPNLKLLSLADV